MEHGKIYEYPVDLGIIIRFDDSCFECQSLHLQQFIVNADLSEFTLGRLCILEGRPIMVGNHTANADLA